jgi:YD repeat-containing protein
VVRDATGREVRYDYNGDGRLSTVTGPDGGVTSYSYVKPPEPKTVYTGYRWQRWWRWWWWRWPCASSSYPNRSDGPFYIGSISRSGTTSR